MTRKERALLKDNGLVVIPTTPFYIHQPTDGTGGILDVIRRTRRSIMSADVINQDEIRDMIKDRLKIIAQWELSCGTILLLQRGRDASGGGPQCFRIIEIRVPLSDGTHHVIREDRDDDVRFSS